MEDDSVRAAWRRAAHEWLIWTRHGIDAPWFALNLATLRALLPPPGQLTIEVGCGEGRVLRALATAGHTVVGVEASPVLAAAVHVSDDPQPVVVADAAALPLRDGCADLVVAHLSLQDVDDLHGAVAEIARVLCSRGRLCAAIVHPLNSAGEFSDRTAGAPFVIAGSYLASRRYVDVVERDGARMTFTSVHRSIEAYAGALQAAGLAIEALREPVPGDALVSDDPAHARWRRVPLFLHLRAVKLR